MDLEADYHDIWSEHIVSKTLSPEVLKIRSHLNRQQRLEMRNNPAKYKAYLEEQDRKYEEFEKTVPKYEHMFVSDDDIMDKLVALIEPPEVQKLYHATNRWKIRMDYNGTIDNILIHINEVDEPIPIRANADYREAIREAWNEYSENRVIETLPLVFAEYAASIKENKPFSWKTNSHSGGWNNPDIRDRVLAARKWKGEPENFDFLKKENLPKNATKMNPEEEKQKALWRQQKFNEIKEELLQNEKFNKFIENIDPKYRDSFISGYAQKKIRWLEYGPQHVKWNLRDDLQWIEDATDRIKEIQQKKLFDVQCQWRAEKIILAEVKVTQDFYYWEANIFNCPFIEPATPQEIDLYLQYLAGNNFEPRQGWFERWQDYRQIKQAYNTENENRNFPEWYDFHNGRTGHSAYLLLPDIRGEKEELYLDFWRKETTARAKEKEKEAESLKALTHAAGIAPADEPDRRPRIHHDKSGWMTWFINTFEDKDTQEMFQRYGGERPFRKHDHSIAEALKLLAESGELQPVEAGPDWKEAIHRAAEKYSIKKIIEAMPAAYERYRMNIDLLIPFEYRMTRSTKATGFVMPSFSEESLMGNRGISIFKPDHYVFCLKFSFLFQLQQIQKEKLLSRKVKQSLSRKENTV